jgi:hypothetical protein
MATSPYTTKRTKKRRNRKRERELMKTNEKGDSGGERRAATDKR